jgi:3',5'-cyclic-AMP phosphodiesterase
MLLLHLSDLHLSRFGESGIWSQREKDEGEHWKPLQVWEHWQVEGCWDKKGRPDKLRLVDPEGVVHKVKSWPSKRDDRVITTLLARAMKRHQTSTTRLVKERPPADELKAMLSLDPWNTNLRFMKILYDIYALNPHLIVITGDITDNGFGYELVSHYLRPWIEARRLFAVPGNHDAYDMLPLLGRMARAAARVDSYREFAEKSGLAPNPTGAYVRRIGDVAIVGLNSCMMPRTPLSASGAVSKEQLVWLRQLGRDAAFASARFRVGLVHHHLLRMPFLLGKRTPIEMAMRLRNAVEVMEVCTEAHMDILLNGHRHHGYMVQLPGRPMVLSAPSSTLGCKSIRQSYGWLLDLSQPHPMPRVYTLNGLR